METRHTWRKVIPSAVLAVCFCAGCATRSDAPPSAYPNRPIKLIVPFGAGGGTDVYARVIDKAIKDHSLLPQPFVIINVGGAGATIGSRRVKNALPDGYTVLILHDAIITAKLYGQASYGPDAFEPVIATGELGMVIAVHEDSPHKSLTDLLNFAKAHPSEVKFGANLGALTHYAGLLLEKESPDSKFNYIQSGGGASRFAEMVGGHIDVTGFSMEEFTRFRSKGLRGLTVFSEKRDPAIPKVPTAKEQGFDVTMSNTFYWWVPKGTPKARIAVLAKALRRAVQTPGVRERLAAMHCRPISLQGDELRERIETSAQRYARVSVRPTMKLPNYPLLAATAIALLCGLRGWQIQREKRRQVTDASVASSKNEFPGDTVAPRNRTAIAVGLAVVLYFGVLSREWLPFAWATTVFVLITGSLLLSRTRRSIGRLIVLAVVMGFGLQQVLMRVFNVYLP